MEISKVKKTLETIIKVGKLQPITPFLKGKPGIGKSHVVNQFAIENELMMIDLRLSQLDSVDIRGIPRIDYENQITKWFPPEFLPFRGIKKWEGTKGILFLDEINRSKSDVLQAIFQLIYDRKVGEYELFDDWFIVCAGNMGYEDGTDVIEFDSALKNRLFYIDVDVNVDDWISWAEKEEINKYIVEFIKKYPNFLFMEFENEAGKKYVTPRSWEQFNNILKINDYENIIGISEIIAASLLNGAAPKFIEYLNDIKKLDAKKIVEKYDNDVDNILKNMERHDIYALSEEIAQYLNANKSKKNNIENVEKFTKFLEDDSLISFWKKIANKENGIKFIKKYFNKNKKEENKIKKILLESYGY